MCVLQLQATISHHWQCCNIVHTIECSKGICSNDCLRFSSAQQELACYVIDRQHCDDLFQCISVKKLLTVWDNVECQWKRLPPIAFTFYVVVAYLYIMFKFSHCSVFNVFLCQLCLNKTCLQFFNNNLNKGWPITVILIYLLFRQLPLNVRFIAHITHFMWLSYLGKFQILIIKNCKKCWFSNCYNAKICYMQNYNYDNLLTYYSTSGLRFIADEILFTC